MNLRNIIRPLTVLLLTSSFVFAGGCAEDDGSGPTEGDSSSEADDEGPNDDDESSDDEMDDDELDDEGPSGKDATEDCDIDSECNSGICFGTHPDDESVMKCTITCSFGGGECDAIGWTCAEVGTDYFCVQ